jgi:cob(I)alamin adenosyltransferase
MGNRLSRIYTRTGDDGTTGLGDGTRVPKEHPRVEGLWLGRRGIERDRHGAGGATAFPPRLPSAWSRCSTSCSTLGGELCIPGHRAITDAHVTRLEHALDGFNEPLAPLKDFILPGAGGAAAGACHLARTITRRAERRVWELARTEPVAPPVAQVPEPAIRPAVRRRARAGTARERQRGCSGVISGSSCGRRRGLRR